MSRESMKLALEALEKLAKVEHPSHKVTYKKRVNGHIVTIYPHKIAVDAITLLRQALVDADDTSQERVDETSKAEHEWVGLTDEEIQDLSYLSQKIDEGNAAWFDRLGFARAIEQVLKEKNHG